MIASSLLTYLLHYVIARTIYDAASAAGVSPWLLVAGALAALFVLWAFRRRTR